MTPEDFKRIISKATVRLVSSNGICNGGLFVEGVTQEELSEIVTLASQRLGQSPEGYVISHRWLELGPKFNVAFSIDQSSLITPPGA